MLDIIVAGCADHVQSDFDRQIEVAYLTAMLGRAKKLPRLADLTARKKSRPAKPTDWRAMLKVAEAWAGSTAGPAP